MKNRLVLIVILFTHFNLTGQDSLSKYMNNIRKEFVDINSNLKNYNKISYQYKSKYDTIDFIAYYNYSQRVLLVSNEKRKGYSEKNHIYSDVGGNLLFVFQETFDWEGIQKQRRLYYHNNKLIKVLTKIKDRDEHRPFHKIPNKLVPYSKEKYETIETQNFHKLASFFEKFETYPVFPATTDYNHKIDMLKKEYEKINSQKSSYEEKTATYTMEYDPDEGQFEYWSVTYTGYFDSKSELKLLTFSMYDHGYGSDYGYYFKDEKVFFLSKTNDFEPENEKSIEHYYIYNGKPILALLKEKTYDDETPFSKMSFVKDNKLDYQLYMPLDTHKSFFFSALFENE